jgi:CheY-like chemotaxis protein
MKILVVEDQDSIRRMIEALVTGRGHDVVGVANGAKALEACMHDPPEIVLLDLNLPGHYDGFEVCRRLRMDPATREVPVVIISALDDPDSRRKAADAGATAYYSKPFSPIALLKEIETLKGRIAKSEP